MVRKQTAQQRSQEKQTEQEFGQMMNEFHDKTNEIANGLGKTLESMRGDTEGMLWYTGLLKCAAQFYGFHAYMGVHTKLFRPPDENETLRFTHILRDAVMPNFASGIEHAAKFAAGQLKPAPSDLVVPPEKKLILPENMNGQSEGS